MFEKLYTRTYLRGPKRNMSVCVSHLKIFCVPFRWFPEVQNIYYQGNKRKQVPTNASSAQLEAFFDCAAALMTQQLQSFALASMQDFTDLIVQPPVSRIHRQGYMSLSV